MAESVGSVKYTVELDTSKLSSGLKQTEKEVQASTSRTEKLLDSIKQKGAGALDTIKKKSVEAFKNGIKASAIAATTAVIGIGKAALDSYADYEQLTGGIETLYKDSYDKVMQYANEAYKTAGLSANQYMETSTSFAASLLQGLGGDTAKAADYANKAIVDMSDNANKMGTSIESIQYAYQGFAKQNYTMLDNLKLGYGGTASEMARLVNESGVMGKDFKATAKNINDVSFDKIVEAIHVVQTNLGITGTTAAEAADTISGSVSSMKGAWQNLLTGIADDKADFGGLIDNFVESLSNVVKNIGPRIKIIAEGIVKLLNSLMPIIAQYLPPLIQTLLPTVITATIQIAMALINALPMIVGLIGDALIQNAGVIVEALWKMLPVIIGFFLGGPIGAMVGALLLPIIDAMGSALADFCGWIFDNFITPVLGFFGELWKGIQSIFGKVVSFFTGIFNTIKNIFVKVGQTVGNILGGAFKGVVNGVLTIAENIINGPIRAINGLISVINAIPGVNIGKLKEFKLPRMATGGIVPSSNGGRLILAGEGGQNEWVVPESKMASLVDQINQRTMTQPPINITVQGVFATSEFEQRKVAQQIADKLQQIQRQRLGA